MRERMPYIFCTLGRLVYVIIGIYMFSAMIYLCNDLSKLLFTAISNMQLGFDATPS